MIANSSNTLRSAIARQWELLRSLPSRGTGKTAKELTDNLVAAGYVVSKRQVERDLLDLSAIFPLYCNDSGKPYGWRWADHAAMELPGLTIAEALSLKLVEAALQPLLPPAITAALLPRIRDAEKKLAALESSNVNARWAHKVRSISPGLNLAAAPVDARVLEAIQEALLTDEQIEVSYRAGNGKETTSLVLHPLALVTRGPASYLIATAFAYTDIRRYALHRIVSAKRLHLLCQRPTDFDIDEYLRSGGMQFGEGKLIDFEALITPSLALVLSETPLSADQSLMEEDARYRLKATYPDSWQLRWWILGQGDQLEVVEPAALREEIFSNIKRAASQYA